MSKQKGTAAKPSANGHPAPPREAAYFLSLTVENVRCFGPKQTLDLSDGHGKPAPWTIILGLNGTGKTTLLQSLAYPTASFRKVTFREGERPEDFDSHFAVGVRRSRDRQTARITMEGVEQSLGTRTMFGGADMWDLKSHGLNFELVVNGAVPRCFAYGAGRRVGWASLSEVEADDPTATLFSDTAPLRNPEEWLLQLDYAAAKSKDKVAQRRLAQAKELLLAIMPEGEITDIRCEAGSGTHPKPRAEFLTPYGWVPLRQLGYGYQTLITWVADLANRMAERYPDSPHPLAEPAVVLVDEIDLHLHPQWQRKLMGFLTDRFPNTQFIATAHSPLVVQAAADANLAVLKRNGDHVVIDNDVDNIRNLRVDQILTSELFGLKTARPPQIEPLLEERAQLLSKSKMTAADKRRVQELDAQMGELPVGETTKEIEERQKILQLLESLTKEKKVAQ